MEDSALKLRGWLKIERGGDTKKIFVNIDLDRNSGRQIESIGDHQLVIDPERLPIENLALSIDTVRLLKSKGINTLAQISACQLEEIGLSVRAQAEVVDEVAKWNIVVQPEATNVPVEPGTESMLPAITPSQSDRLVDAFLEKPIEVLDLSFYSPYVDIAAKLKLAGIITVGDLTQYSRRGLESIEGLGERSLGIIEERLEYFGLKLKPVEKSYGGKRGRRALKWVHFGDALKDFTKPTLEQIEKAKSLLTIGGKKLFPLFETLRESPDWEAKLVARNELTVANKNLSWRISLGYRDRIEIDYIDPALDLDDLEQEGIFGLMRAIEHYDYTLGFRFSTYAHYWIRNYMQRAIDGPISLPRYIHEQAATMEAGIVKLAFNLGREPTIPELADFLQWKVKDLEELMETIRICRHLMTLDPYWDASDQGLDPHEDATSSLYEVLPNPQAESPEEGAAFHELCEKVQKILAQSSLMDVEKHCLEHYFGLSGQESKTLEAIGDSLGVTRERVRQRVEAALEKLRTVENWEETRDLMSGLQDPRTFKPTPAWVRAFECLGQIIRTQSRTLEAPEILKHVMTFFSATLPELRAPQRGSEAVVARRVAAHLLHYQSNLGDVQIASLLGFTDQNGVKSAVAKVVEQIQKWEQDGLLFFEPKGSERTAEERLQLVAYSNLVAYKPIDCFEYVLKQDDHGRPEQIIATVASQCRVDTSILQNRQVRGKGIELARAIIAYFLSRHCYMTYTELAPLAGYNDFRGVVRSLFTLRECLRLHGKERLWQENPYHEAIS